MKKSFWGNKVFVYCGHYAITFAIILPLCLIQDVSKLRFFSFFGIFSLVSIIVLLIIELPSYIKYYNDEVYDKDDPSTHRNYADASRAFGKDYAFFQLCSSLYYAYVQTIGALPIFNSLNVKIMRAIQKVVTKTIQFDIFLFTIISIVGFFTWPINTPSLILQRPKITEGADIPMSIGRILLVITAIVKVANSYTSLRICLMNIIWGPKTTELSTLTNTIMTILILFFCSTLSVLYTGISGYIKLIGGICSSVVGFLFPAILYLKLKEKSFVKRVCILIAFGIVICVGFISAGTTLYEIVTGKG